MVCCRDMLKCLVGIIKDLKLEIHVKHLLTS
nr:MAG TPA: hypothetical protein [Caudoviricetes sp.]